MLRALLYVGGRAISEMMKDLYVGWGSGGKIAAKHLAVSERSAERGRLARRARNQAADTCGQATSITQPGPAAIVKRNPCNFRIAATRLRPSPTPWVCRLLSERYNSPGTSSRAS